MYAISYNIESEIFYPEANRTKVRSLLEKINEDRYNDIPDFYKNKLKVVLNRIMELNKLNVSEVKSINDNCNPNYFTPIDWHNFLQYSFGIIYARTLNQETITGTYSVSYTGTGVYCKKILNDIVEKHKYPTNKIRLSKSLGKKLDDLISEVKVILSEMLAILPPLDFPTINEL